MHHNFTPADSRYRGTVIKPPDSTPGLLIVGGSQYTFELRDAVDWAFPARAWTHAPTCFNGSSQDRGVRVSRCRLGCAKT